MANLERGRRRRPFIAHVPRAILLGLMGMAEPAAALPPGKAWTPISSFSVPGHSLLFPGRMETDGSGVPLVFAEARGGIGRDSYVLRWADSTWRVVTSLGYGTKFVHYIVSPPSTHYLIWNGLDDIETPIGFQSSLVFSRFLGDRVLEPDTIARVHSASLDYSAAVSAARRWVAVSDLFDMRLFWADLEGPWSEVPIDGSGAAGATVTALDDTTALVVWLGGIFQQGRSAVLRGQILEEISPPPFKVLGPLAGNVEFRRRPSGGQWMTWPTIEEHVGIATFKDGRWSAPESLECAYLLSDGYTSQSIPHMSNDDAEYPVVAWMGLSRKNLLETVCVCVPGDSGFPVAENLEGSSGGQAPVVARDRHGDAWVAWGGDFPAPMRWLHTWTTATVAGVGVVGAGRSRAVRWTLSEPAPASWWAVLRARHDGPFEEVARVRAGSGTEMSWTDTSPPAGVLRYRIRRESLDARYRWESEEAHWPPKSQRVFSLSRASAGPGDGQLELAGADAGPIEVRVYDLQGRLVVAHRAQAGGTGRDTVQLDFAERARSLPNGIYFAAARDASGRVTNPLKLVILR